MRAVLAAVLAGLVALAAGCGGSEGKKGPSAAARLAAAREHANKAERLINLGMEDAALKEYGRALDLYKKAKAQAEKSSDARDKKMVVAIKDSIDDVEKMMAELKKK